MANRANTITVYRARRIRTMDPGRPVADAVAVMDGRVLSTGSLESMRPWLGPSPYVIDDTLADKIIIPGLIEPHAHLLKSWMHLTLPYVGPIASPGPNGTNSAVADRVGVIEALRRELADSDDRVPLVAWGFEPALQGGHLDRHDLDAVSSDRAVFVVSYAPHFVYANGAALEAVGLGASTTIHGVQHDPAGQLTWVFIEAEAINAILGDTLERRTIDGPEGLRRLAQVALASGVTTAAEMGTDLDTAWPQYVEATADSSFPIRMVITPWARRLIRLHGDRAVESLVEFAAQGSDRLQLHGVKFMSDGSYPAMSSRVRFPGYLDGTNGVRGDFPWDELADRMFPFWTSGVPIHCHANGDEAIDATLDALASLQQRHPRFDHRFTIEHYAISTPEQARRLHALGGLASVNSYFIHYRSQLHSRQGFGPDRSEAVARLKSLEQAGVTFALHSDFSLVAVPIHPLTAAWAAVNRVAADGTTIMAPHESVGVERAIRAITIDAAYVLGLENAIGSIEPSKLADFAVLEEDPFEVEPGHLRDIRVWGTVLGGRLQPAG